MSDNPKVMTNAERIEHWSDEEAFIRRAHGEHRHELAVLESRHVAVAAHLFELGVRVVSLTGKTLRVLDETALRQKADMDMREAIAKSFTQSLQIGRARPEAEAYAKMTPENRDMIEHALDENAGRFKRAVPLLGDERAVTPADQKDLYADKRGVTALEYGIIAALIAVVIVGSVTSLGKNVSVAFSHVASAVTNTK